MRAYLTVLTVLTVASVMCSVSHAGECEIVDVQEAGLEQEGNFYVYEITITVDCENASAGGGGESDWDSAGAGGGGGEEESEGGGGGGGGGGGPSGGSPGSPIIPVEDGMEVELINMEETTPCVQNIITQLQQKDHHYSVIPDPLDTEGASHIAQGILDIFSASQQYHLEFQVDEAGVSSNGFPRNGLTTTSIQTPEVGDVTFIIRLDDDYVAQATTLAIARTIIHESIHAFLHYSTATTPTFMDETGEGFSNLLQDYMDQYQQQNPNASSNQTANYAHHEVLAMFVEAAALSLAAWDNHNQTDEYYQNLFWGSLQGTTAYDALPQDRKAAIEAVNIAEGTAYSSASASAHGETCD